jgi:hypothetical protein
MSVWTERTARRNFDCERCNCIIETGSSYLDRGMGRHSRFCIPCYKALMEAGEKKRTKRDAVQVAKPYHRQKVRLPGSPLLGLGHVVHGLGVLLP